MPIQNSATFQYRYGTPWLGSKSRICEQVVAALPPAPVFVDLFFGGGAVSHCYAYRRRPAVIIGNDVDGRGQSAFLAGLRNPPPPEWIEYGHQREAPEPWIECAFSFAGRAGKSYFCAPEFERWQRNLYDYLTGRTTGVILEQMAGVDVKAGFVRGQLLRNYQEARLKIADWMLSHGYPIGRIKEYSAKTIAGCQPFSIWRRLCAISERFPCDCELRLTNDDYASVEIPKGAVVYADPPYAGTTGYGREKFDSARFWDYVRRSPALVVVSELSAPPDFVCVREIGLRYALANASGHGRNVSERLFVHSPKIAAYNAAMGLLDYGR